MSGSTPIQEQDLDPNMGLAKEATLAELMALVEETKSAAEEAAAAASSGGSSVIKSVQRGVITIAASATEGTATISSVNTAKAIVVFGGSIYGSTNDSNSDRWDARLVLQSATKVHAQRAYAASYTAIVPYQVIEFV